MTIEVMLAAGITHAQAFAIWRARVRVAAREREAAQCAAWEAERAERAAVVALGRLRFGRWLAENRLSDELPEERRAV